MGQLQAAADAIAGTAKIETLGQISDQTEGAVQQIAQIGRNYHQFRGSLGGDEGDEQFADAKFAVAIARDKATLDDLPDDVREWVDRYIQGLGYTKV